MKILCTFPGRHGDILWALPTVRAISRYYGVKVDLVVAYKYRRVMDLVREGCQDYVRYAWGDPEWIVDETAPITPREPRLPIMVDGGDARGPQELKYDEVFHLGYTGWPAKPLAEEIWGIAGGQAPADTLDTSRGFSLDPWITLPAAILPIVQVIVGWSEEWIELKMGVSAALWARFPHWHFHHLFYPESRQMEWLKTEARSQRVGYHASDSWKLRGLAMGEGTVFLGDLSGLWVLANALGKHAVVCEPEEMRHHPIFWRAAPQNLMVTGNAGRPTFDARHVGDCLETMVRIAGRKG